MEAVLLQGVDDLAGAEEPLEIGDDCKVGAKGKKTTITNTQALFKALEAIKPGLGWQCMSFNLTDVGKYLNDEELKPYVETKHVSKRRVTLS